MLITDKAGGYCFAALLAASIIQLTDKKKYPFEIRFNQGSADPFVKSGENKCDLAGNKQGKLRCRVKGKGVPEGIYRYSIHVPGCDPTHAQFKVY